jgi:membrane dipeptidase
MRVIDLHCDTISELMKRPGETLVDNQLCINQTYLKAAGSIAQFFACFVHANQYEKKYRLQEVESSMYFGEIRPQAWDDAYADVLKMLARIDSEQNGTIKVAESVQEIYACANRNQIAAVKTVEEGGILNGQMERLHTLCDQGVRLITLTWNFPNCIGFPNSRTPAIMEKGLTPFGHDVIAKMNELGMIIDVSHLSDGGFWDCIRGSKAPLCASHSNARALCNYPRNLTDEMLSALGEGGGIAGLNFYPAFLSEKRKATVEDLADHAWHMIQKGGEDLVALGSDFDGFENEAREDWLANMGDLSMLWEAMKKKGITERQIEKIASTNVLRYMENVQNSTK